MWRLSNDFGYFRGDSLRGCGAYVLHTGGKKGV